MNKADNFNMMHYTQFLFFCCAFGQVIQFHMLVLNVDNTNNNLMCSSIKSSPELHSIHASHSMSEDFMNNGHLALSPLRRNSIFAKLLINKQRFPALVGNARSPLPPLSRPHPTSSPASSHFFTCLLSHHPLPSWTLSLER